jgi:UDPglucose 6-dehydrogenase
MADDFDNYNPAKLNDASGMTTADKQKPISPTNPFRLGIVGHGFVGRAVEYAFTHPLVDLHVVDPKYDNNIDSMVEFDPMCTFVCVPTPMNPDTGFVDASIVEDAVLKLIEHTESLVVVKSTITPDIIDRLYNSMFEDGVERFVYNPEFLTEKNAEEQFVNAEFHVLGGSDRGVGELTEIYDIFSLCKSDQYYRMSAAEASFVKYGINSFLATKVTFFNQMFDLVNSFGCSYNIITRVMGQDPRVGIGHTRVPGYDRKRGFGGACLPKDTTAFLKFSEFKIPDGPRKGEIVSFDLLKNVLDINNRYRSEYELDEREKVNNITFDGDSNERDGQTEEELKDQDNGSSVGE